jgi:urease accessory protein UreE
MTRGNKKADEIREKIREGVDLTFRKLVQQKSLTDDTLIFSENGKIIEVKAKDLIKLL